MFTCGAWVYTCGAIASTAGVGLSIPPVAPADVPAIPAQDFGIFTSGGAEMFTCGAWGCLPTVFRPRGAVFTCGADIYLRCFWDVYLRWGRDVYA